MTYLWRDWHAAEIRAADPATRTSGITGLDRLRAVQRLIAYLKEGPQMGKQARADADGWASIYLGSTLSGGSGTVRGNAGIGRKGQGKVLTPAEIKAIRRQQAADIKAARKAAKAAKAKGKK